MLKVELLAHSPNPEKIVAAAAKLCYSSSSIDGILDGLDDEKIAKFVEMLMGLGHESTIEHVTFTFGIEGVSRSLLAQITRHRIASYSVKSQRYVNEGHFEFVTPPEIAKNKEALAIFNNAMEDDLKKYNELSDILKKQHIKELTDSGTDEVTAAKKAEKMAIEDARYVLSNACETKMVATFNARSLLNFFHHRCCERAQWEIRALADEMLKLVKDVAPTLFKFAGPPCIGKGCPEGKMSCGKMAEKKEKYLGK